MKQINIFSLLIIGIYSCLWSAEGHSEFDVLGQRFVRAVAANDVIQFAHCWMGREQMVKLGTEIAKKQTPEISDKIMGGLAQLESSLDKRNQNLVYGFKALCEHVQTHTQLFNLEFVSLSGRITEKMGMKRTSMFTLVMDFMTENNGILLIPC